MLSPKTPPALVAPALAWPQHVGSLRPLHILRFCGTGTGPGGSQAARRDVSPLLLNLQAPLGLAVVALARCHQWVSEGASEGAQHWGLPRGSWVLGRQHPVCGGGPTRGSREGRGLCPLRVPRASPTASPPPSPAHRLRGLSALHEDLPGGGGARGALPAPLHVLQAEDMPGIPRGPAPEPRRPSARCTR